MPVDYLLILILVAILFLFTVVIGMITYIAVNLNNRVSNLDKEISVLSVELKDLHTKFNNFEVSSSEDLNYIRNIISQNPNLIREPEKEIKGFSD